MSPDEPIGSLHPGNALVGSRLTGLHVFLEVESQGGRREDLSWALGPRIFGMRDEENVNNAVAGAWRGPSDRSRGWVLEGEVGEL